MIIFWVLLFLAFFLIDRLHRLNLETIVLEHQFRLYALRDKLREAAMRKEVNPKDWVFLYLDSSIAKSIGVLGRITLWRILLMLLVHRPDRQRILARQANLSRELAKPENKCFAEIYCSYFIETGRYLLRRHILLRTVGTILNLMAQRYETSFLRKIIQFARTGWQKARETLTQVPETSTLENFAPVEA